MQYFFEEAPTIQKSTSQSMEFLAYASLAHSSPESAKFFFWGFPFAFLSFAAIRTCSVVAVKKLGYKAEDVDIEPSVYLGMINGVIISSLILRQCQ